MLVKSEITSRSVSLVAMFAAMIAVLDVIPVFPGFYSGVWDSWAFLLSPLVGVLLGPYLGALSVGLGSFVGHMIYFRDPYELVFMFGAPLGAMVSGFIYNGRWRPALGTYTFLLAGYFLTPVAWGLPLWGIWDILVGYAFVLAASIITVKNFWPSLKEHAIVSKLLFSTVIGLESDILLRVFILIPGQTYWFFYGLTSYQLELIWLAAGFITPIKVAMSAIVCILLGLALNRQMQLHEDAGG